MTDNKFFFEGKIFILKNMERYSSINAKKLIKNHEKYKNKANKLQHI